MPREVTNRLTRPIILSVQLSRQQRSSDQTSIASAFATKHSDSFVPRKASRCAASGMASICGIAGLYTKVDTMRCSSGAAFFNKLCSQATYCSALPTK